MSTTHSTPDPGLVLPYTVVGRRPGAPGGGPALILLNRSSRLVRRDYLAELIAAGFTEIISVEPQENSFSVEALNQEFPAVRFLLLRESRDVGTRINLAASIVDADSFIVMWSSMNPPGDLSRPGELFKDPGTVCVAPALRGDHGESLPVVQVPALQRRSLRILPLPLRGQPAATLFPFDFAGMYHRSRFLESGGYDERIQQPFWQKLDFGFRLAMWNQRILVSPVLRMSYRTMPDPEDQTPTPGYARFFARNLAVRLRDNHPTVPRIQAFPFAFRAGLGLRQTLRTFSEASQWVEQKKDLFRRDARQVINEWSDGHG